VSTNHHEGAGYAAAAAMVALVVADDMNGVMALADEILRGDDARETITALATVAASYAFALSDLKMEPVANVIDRLAGEAASFATEKEF